MSDEIDMHTQREAEREFDLDYPSCTPEDLLAHLNAVRLDLKTKRMTRAEYNAAIDAEAKVLARVRKGQAEMMAMRRAGRINEYARKKAALD